MGREYKIKIKADVDAKDLKKIDVNYKQILKQMEKDSAKGGKDAGEDYTKGFSGVLKKAGGAIFGGFFSSIGGQLRKGLQNAVSSGVKGFVDLDKGIREVMTLLDEKQIKSLGGMEALKKQAQDLAQTFGQDIPTATRAMYDAISSGVDPAAMDKVTEAAGRLAVGGVTDVGTAINGITNLANAYKLNYSSVEDLNKITDTLFTGMKKGKTTIGDLSNNLGKVAPIAAQLNVPIEQLVGGVATLTTNGLSTSQSITQMKSMMTAIVKPSKQAQEIFTKLGISFGQSAFESQNFAEWLTTTKQKLDASGLGLEKVFGNVNALGGAMALTGKSAETFNDILKEMDKNAEQSGKATADAFAKTDESIDQKMKKMQAKMQNVFINIIEKLMPVFDAILPLVDKILPIIESISPLIGAIATAIGEVLESDFVQWIISATGAINNFLTSVINPTGHAKAKMDELYNSIQNNKQILEQLNGITINTDLVKSKEDLLQKIDQINQVAPKLAENMYAIATSDADLAEKIRLVNQELNEFKDTTSSITPDEMDQMVVQFTKSQKKAYNEYYNIQEKIIALEEKRKKQGGELADRDKKTLMAYQAKIKNIATDFESEFSKLMEMGISKEDIKRLMGTINTEFAKSETMRLKNPLTAMWEAASGEFQERVGGEAEAMYTLIAGAFKKQEDAQARAVEMEQTKNNLTKEYLELTTQLDNIKQGTLQIDDSILKDQEKFNSLSKEQKSDLLDRLETIKATAEASKSWFKGADTTDIDNNIAKIQDAINNLNTTIKLDVQTDTAGVEGIGDLAKPFESFKINIFDDPDMIQQGFYMIQQEYQNHLQEIKALKLEDKETENAMILELEQQKNEVIQAMLHDQFVYTGQEAEGVLNNVISLAAEGGDQQQSQIQSIIASETERLSVIEGQTAELKKQYGAEYQSKLREIIALEQEKRNIIKSASSISEATAMEEEYNLKKDALQAEADSLKATMDGLDKEVQKQQKLVDDIKSASKLSKKQIQDAKKVSKEKKASLQADYDLIDAKKKEEEKLKKEEEKRLKKEEQERKKALAEQKKLADDLFKREQAAADYISDTYASNYQVVQDVKKQFEEFDKAYSKNSNELLDLGKETQREMRKAFLENQKNLINSFAEESQKSIDDLNITDMDSITQGFSMLDDYSKSVDDLVELMGKDIPKAFMETLEKTGYDMIRTLNQKIDEAYEREKTNLLVKYGGDKYNPLKYEQARLDVAKEIVDQSKIVTGTVDEKLNQISDYVGQTTIDMNKVASDFPNDATLQNFLEDYQKIGAFDVKGEKIKSADEIAQDIIKSTAYQTLFDAFDAIATNAYYMTSEGKEGSLIEYLAEMWQPFLKDIDKPAKRIDKIVDMVEKVMANPEKNLMSFQEDDRKAIEQFYNLWKNIDEFSGLDKTYTKLSEIDKDYANLQVAQSDLDDSIKTNTDKLQEYFTKLIKAYLSGELTEGYEKESQQFAQDLELILERAKARIDAELAFSDMQKQYTKNLTEFELAGKDRIEILKAQLVYQKALTDQKEKGLVFGVEDVELEQEILNLKLEEKRIAEEISDIEKETAQARLEAQKNLNDAIKADVLYWVDRAKEFGNTLVDAFEDGKLSMEETTGMINGVLTSIAGNIPGVVGEVAGAVVGVFGFFVDIFTKLTKKWHEDWLDTKRKVYEDEIDAQNELNDKLEMHNDLLETTVDTITNVNEQIELRIESLQEEIRLLQEINELEGSSIEDAKNKYEQVLKTIEVLQQMLDMENMSEVDRIGFIQQYKDILLEAGVISEDFYNVLSLPIQDFLTGNLSPEAFEQMLNQMGLSLSDFNEILLNSFGGLDQQDLIDIIENQIIPDYEGQRDQLKKLVDANNELSDVLEEEIRNRFRIIQLQAELADDEEGALQSQIDMLEEILSRADELKLTDIERLEMQVELKDLYEQQNEALGQQGALIDEQVRAIIRQVIEARKLGNMAGLQQNLEEAAQILEMQGYNTDQINEWLGTNFENVGGGLEENIGINPEFSPMINSLDRGNELSITRNELLMEQNSILQQAFGLVINENRKMTASLEANSSKPITASNIMRVFSSIDKKTRS